MKTYWRPLVGNTVYHCWTDSAGELKITASCGYKAFRKQLETNVPFENASDQKRCKNCVRALER